MAKLVLIDQTDAPAGVTPSLVQFVYEYFGLARAVTVRIHGPRRQEHQPESISGWAVDRENDRHRKPSWVATRFGVSIYALGYKTSSFMYGTPLICAHAHFIRADHGGTDPYYLVEQAYREGQTKIGRWPIHVVHCWEEAVVHVLAHEFAHCIQWENNRGASEVKCEQMAFGALEAFRRQKGTQ